MTLTKTAIPLPPELLDAIADRVVERLPNRPEPWLNTADAAAYLACPRSRIFDLVERGVLEPQRDGRRLLFRARELDAAVSDRQPARNGHQRRRKHDRHA